MPCAAEISGCLMWWLLRFVRCCWFQQATASIFHGVNQWRGYVGEEYRDKLPTKSVDKSVHDFWIRPFWFDFGRGFTTNCSRLTRVYDERDGRGPWVAPFATTLMCQAVAAMAPGVIWGIAAAHPAPGVSKRVIRSATLRISAPKGKGPRPRKKRPRSTSPRRAAAS